MTSIFDRWTDLDPALALRRIEAAHGSAIFDKYSYLDPQRALRQIEDALDIELDDKAGALSFASLEAAIDAVVASDTPEWVPENAVIYIDLVNDRAWSEDDGEVAIDTLLGTDANTVNAWGATSYDAGNLTADGYVNGTVAFIGTMRSFFLAGATISTRWKSLSTDGTSFIAAVATDGNDGIELNITTQNGSLSSDSFGGSLNLFYNDSVLNNGSNVVNGVAVTLVSDRLDMAANGVDAITSPLLDADRPVANPFTAALFVADTIMALQSITIYDALPDTTGLSALSTV